MSFYMTLPSNSSSNHYNNKQSNYTTKLDNPLSFSVPYEVALVEFSYRQYLSFDIGMIKIKFNKDNDYRPCRIRIFDNEPIEHLIERMNYEISEYYTKLAFLVNTNKIDPYQDHFEMIRDFDKHLKEGLVFDRSQQPTIKMPTFGLKKDYKNRLFLDIPENTIVVFDGYCNTLFKGYQEMKSYHEFVLLSEFLNFVDYLMVYCDIVDPQNVGDTYAQLLRTICTTGEFNKSTEKIYTTPHYIPVCKSFITNINIDIRDPSGEQVKFENLLSKVLVKLHFRPIRNV